jgi:anti-sigma B factor antagonist
MSSTGDLQLDAHALGSGHLITARGEIDHVTARELADSLRRVTLEEEGNVVLDLTHTSFIDSAGISTLLNGLRRLTRLRRRLIIVCPHGAPRRVFEILGLVGTFELVENRDEARAGV